MRSVKQAIQPSRLQLAPSMASTAQQFKNLESAARHHVLKRPAFYPKITTTHRMMTELVSQMVQKPEAGHVTSCRHSGAATRLIAVSTVRNHRKVVYKLPMD